MIILPIVATVVAFAISWRQTRLAVRDHPEATTLLVFGGAAGFVIIALAIWMGPA